MKESEQQEQKDHLLNKDNDDQNKINIPSQKSMVEKIYNDNQNIAFGLSFLGRIIMTFYSLHGLFFCYNLILEYILLIPCFLFRINNWFGKFCLSLVYIFYSLCLSSILVIPTFEFLTFPYLKYPNSLSHLISFIYIYREKPFNHKEIIHENQKTTIVLNIIFYVIEILYVAGYLLSFLSKIIILKDLIKSILLIFAYMNYFTVFMNYVFVSLYLIIKILSSKPEERIIIYTTEKGVLKKVDSAKNIGYNNNKIEFTKEIGNNNYKLTIENKDEENQDEYKVMIEKYIKKDITNYSWKGFNLAILLKINNYFKDKPKLPDINLVSYIIEPYLIRNYVDKDGNELDKLEEYYFEDVCFNLGIIFKLIFFIVIFVITLVYSFFTINLESFFYLVLLSFCMLVVSLAFNFPFCYRNRKTFGADICNPKYRLYTEEKKYLPEQIKKEN